MWKPWPIRWFDRNIHGGMGIMVDDIVAGVISAGVLYLIGHHWPIGLSELTPGVSLPGLWPGRLTI